MEQMYEISDNVPIPAPIKKHNFPYDELQVGESFWVANTPMPILCNCNRRQGKRLNRKFICRKEGEGVRVWRVA
jgi:hypothetical protein